MHEVDHRPTPDAVAEHIVRHRQLRGRIVQKLRNRAIQQHRSDARCDGVFDLVLQSRQAFGPARKVLPLEPVDQGLILSARRRLPRLADNLVRLLNPKLIAQPGKIEPLRRFS